MLGHLRIRTIDVGLVEAGLGDTRLKIVADHCRGDAAKEGKGAVVRANPIEQRLRPRGFRKRVRTGTQYSDEQLSRDNLAGHPIRDLELRAGVIDEHLLARDVRLAHRRRVALLPRPLQLADLRVTVTITMLLAILLPEQFQRDARPLELAMNDRPIG